MAFLFRLEAVNGTPVEPASDHERRSKLARGRHDPFGAQDAARRSDSRRRGRSTPVLVVEDVA
jgi:hypothetical protein